LRRSSKRIEVRLPWRRGSDAVVVAIVKGNILHATEDVLRPTMRPQR